MKKNILITAGGSPGNEYLWRKLNKKYQLYFLDSSPEKIDPIIPIKNKFYIPKVNSKYYQSEIKKICSNLKINIIVPYIDEELITLRRIFENDKTVQIIIPEARFIKIMLDKYKMIKFYKSKKILTPRSFLLDDENVNFAKNFLIKPRKGRGSRGVAFFSKRNKISDIKSLYRDKSFNWILQEKVEGQEYSVQIFCDKEKNINYIVPVLIFEKRGSTTLAKLNFNKHVISACKNIHNAFPVSGIYNIQLILDKKNNIYPFEINPRPSTTLCFSLKIGIDPFAQKLKNINFDKFNNKEIYLSRHYTNHFYQEDK